MTRMTAMNRSARPEGLLAGICLLFLVHGPGASADWPALDELIAASREATVETEPVRVAEDFTVSGRAPRPIPRPAPFSAAADWPVPRPPAPGRVLAWEPRDKPLCVQPLDDGRVLIGSADGLSLVEPGAATPARVILDAGARNLAPDQSGRRILVTTCGEPPFVVIDAESLTVTSRIRGNFGGAVAWWGEKSGELLLVREAIDFSGRLEKRIHTLLETMPESGGAPTPIGWPIDVFSRAGTIAPQGLSWGTPARPWQVDPMPGLLVALEGTAVKGPLVEGGPWADTRPAGGSDGRLYWIRTREHGSDSGRLMMRESGGGVHPPRQLTAWPTWQLGVSASGRQVAWIGGAEGPTELRLATAEELQNINTEESAAADRALASSWRSANRRLAEAFATTSVSDDLVTTGPTPLLLSRPTWEDVETMGRAFEQALMADFGLAPREQDLLPVADLVLSRSAGFVGDGPIEVLAVGGFVVREARRRGIGTSLPAAGSPTLSTTEATWAWSDDTTMTLASPWAIARSSLGRSISPGWAIAQFESQRNLPVLWTDGFDGPTRALAREFLLGIAGLPTGEESAIAFSQALEQFPDCDVCALELAKRGVNEGLQVRALEAAEHLARRHPDSPEAFAVLGEVLVANGESAAGRRAMDWAVTLAPMDPMLRFQSASMSFVLGDMARAATEFREVLLLPGGGSLEALVQSRLRLIEQTTRREDAP